jgi:hypothetical protein
MKKDTSFHDFVIYDLMNRLSGISSRPMMSGWCIYFNKTNCVSYPRSEAVEVLGTQYRGCFFGI